MLDKVQKWANSHARTRRCARADTIKFSPSTMGARVSDHKEYGYYKNTTGQKVSNAYRTKFGWKNTHYEYAHTEVTLPLWAGWLAGEDL